jgi:hypothetical protein
MTTALTPSTRNITRAFYAATAEDLVAGREWYRRARAFAEELVTSYGTGVGVSREQAVRTAAGVIAAISPRLSWPKNVELTHWLYGRVNRAKAEPSPTWLVREEGSVLDRFPGLKANGHKAIRILMGEDPEDVLGGPKVRVFYFTIMNPADPRAVVVDRHAIDIAVGRVLNDADRGKLLGRKGAYDAVAELYRRAAKSISKRVGTTWTPAEVQAATWTYWRREHAAAYHGEA